MQRELVESVLHRRHETELAGHLRKLNAAEIAHLLEMVPTDQRLAIWPQVPLEVAGEVLDEVTDSVTERLVRATSRDRIG